MNRKANQKTPFKQLSLRGLDPDLEKQIRELARSNQLSLNKATLMILRRGAGLQESRHPASVVGESLDHLIGSWTANEERQFNKAIKVFERVDRLPDK